MPPGNPDGEAIWRTLLERVRAGEAPPFEEQRDAFHEASARRAPEDGPLPVRLPTERDRTDSNLARLMRERGCASYEALYRWSVERRGEFWEAAIERLGIVWEREPRTLLDASLGAEHPVWARGARLNVVESCFRAGADTPAVVSGREGDERLDVTTVGELLRLTERVASGLRAFGCRPGDAVALFLPLTVECVAAYLGIVRAGCRAVSIADSFSAGELRRRLDIGEAVAIVTVDRFRRAGKTVEVLDRVLAAGAPPAIVIAEGEPELRDGDRTWDEFLGPDESFPAVVADPDDTINVLFSSGTTGTPKAIPWTHLTPIKCAADAHFHQDVGPGDVVAWPTNIGWMMGPWLIFAALVNRATIALFEGAPAGEEFVRFVERAGVTTLGVVPSLVRAWRGLGEPWPAEWSGVRVYSSTGEPSSREDYLWLMSRSGYRAPVIEYCGGTEIGGGYLTGTVVQSASPSTFTTPALGLDLAILDDDGRPVGEGAEGEVFLVPPSIGLSRRLLNRDHHEAYFAGTPRGPRGEVLRRHGDRITRLARGFFRAQGRADDTMNLGGIKVGSLEIERALAGHPDLRACAAVGVQPGGEGAERLVVFVVPDRDGADRDLLKKQLGGRLARTLNPLFRVHDVVLVEALPYTASNKLVRRDLRQRWVEAQGRPTAPRESRS